MAEIDQAVRVEQARYLHDNLTLTVLSAFVAALFAAWVVSTEAPSAHLLVWLTATTLVAVYRLVVRRSWHGRYTADTAGWFARTVTGAGIAGALWGLASVYLLVSGSLPLQFAILYGGVLLTVAAMFSYGAHYPTFLAFFLPLMLPAFFTLLLQRSVLHGGIAAAVAIFTTVATMVGRRFNRNFLESLRLRFENVELVRELTHQKEAAEAANLAKSRFLAAASHDLRQPMHALNLYHGALMAADMPPDARPLLDNACECARAMDEMFAVLLDMSRLDAGAVTPQCLVFPMAPLLERIRIEFQPPAQEKGLRLRVRTSNAMGLGDPALVERIVRNFVSNAVRHTDQGGVLVACRRHGEGLRIAVWDSGPGIPPEMQEAVFEEFLQLGNPERDRNKGLGLGLAIVARLAKLMATPLTLRSTPGRGAMFAVDLPQGTELPPALPTVLPRQKSTLAGRHLAVIDDEVLVCDAVAQVLRGWGCVVTTAASGAEAVALLAMAPAAPDGLICDYRLRDGETGLDAVERLRSEFFVDIPALLVTGDTAPERLREIAASGLPVLHKPLQPEALREALAALLSGGLVEAKAAPDQYGLGSAGNTQGAQN